MPVAVGSRAQVHLDQSTRHPVQGRINVMTTECPNDLVRAAREFADRSIRAAAGEWEAEGRFPAEAFEAAGRAGWTRMMVPEDKGGWGLTLAEALQVVEVLAEYDLAFTFSLVVHANLARAVWETDNSTLQERFGNGLADGSVVGAFCLTEPDAGSDAASVSTTIMADGDELVVTGVKAWVTNGNVAQVFHVFGRLDGGAEGWRGICSAIVPRDTPGITVHEPRRTIGANAMTTTSVDFDGCRIPCEYLLLPEGVAFPTALHAIDIARIFVGAMGSGAMAASLREACTYANERRQFGQPLADFQGLRWLLAELATTSVAGRSLAYQAAVSFDRGEASSMLAAMAKLHVGGMAARTIEQCAQVLGANGFAGDTLLDRLWRQSRMLAIIDGTNEIQREIIGKGLLKAGELPSLPLGPEVTTR